MAQQDFASESIFSNGQPSQANSTDEVKMQQGKSFRDSIPTPTTPGSNIIRTSLIKAGVKEGLSAVQMKWAKARLKSSTHVGDENMNTARQHLEETIAGIEEEWSRYNTQHNGYRPWMNDLGEVTWSPWRVTAAKVLLNPKFEAFMGFLICFNVWVIVYETDHEAQCYPHYRETLSDCPFLSKKVEWIGWTNRALLVVYTTEVLMGMWCFRLKFFRSTWNGVDFFVVVTGIISEVMEDFVNVAFLRICRIARLSRTFRLIMSVRELYLIITGLGSSIRAMFWGLLLLLIMLVAWSIVLVETVHPDNVEIVEPYAECERCHRGFESVTASTITLFQTVVAGDNWGRVSIPIMEKNMWFAPLMIGVLVSIALCIMNLILAVILESASEAREKDIEEQNRQKQKTLLEQKIKLLKLCAEMDKDYSGTVSLTELQNAWSESLPFRSVMMSLEVGKQELEGIFKVLDIDNSGDVDYKEFVDQLYNISTCDMRMMMALSKLDLLETKTICKDKIETGVLTLQEQLKEQGDTLERHEGLLRSMERNILRLCVANNLTEEEEEVKCDDIPVVAEMKLQGFQGEPQAEPPGGECSSSSLPSRRLTDPLVLQQELGSLQQYLQDLSLRNADIVERAKEQSALLTRQVDALASVSESLLDPVAGSTRQQALAKQVGKLQYHVRQRVAIAVKDLERRVDDEVRALTPGSDLLDDLAGEIGLPRMLAESKWRRTGRAKGGRGDRGSARSWSSSGSAQPPSAVAQGRRNLLCCGPSSAVGEITHSMV